MNIVEEYKRFWNIYRDQTVFDFLREEHWQDLLDVYLVIATDQQLRWHQGQRIGAEEYLSGFPCFFSFVEWERLLFASEAEARKNTIEPMTAEELSARAPFLVGQIDLPSLGSPPKSTDLSDMEEIDRICDRFEEQWRNLELEPPLIQEYLSECRDEQRVELLDHLLNIEIWWRCRRGEIPAIEDYREQFPEQEEMLTRLFSTRQAVLCRHWEGPEFRGGHGLQLRMSSTETNNPWPSIHLNLDDTSEGKPRYEILGIVGRGAFGKVLLAQDTLLHREVAIKLYPPQIVKKFGDTKTLLNEARHVSQLIHPNVISIYDFGTTTDGAAYSVFQYVQGRNLGELLQAESLDQRTMIDIIVKVADALQAAHELGILHCDLKPENILIRDSDHEVFLVDFGFAREANNTSLRSEWVGTPAYWSPEQTRGKVDRRSDQYSLAAILYQMFARQLPAHGTHIDELVERIQTQAVRPIRASNPSVPRSLERVCMRALSKKPADRYPSVGEFRRALESSLKSNNTPLHHQNIGRLGFATAAVICLVWIGFWGWTSYREPSKTGPDSLANANSGGNETSTLIDPKAEAQEIMERLGEYFVSEMTLVKNAELLANRNQGTFYPVEHFGGLQSGDTVRMHLMLARSAYVKIFWMSSSGEPQQIYPEPTAEPQKVVVVESPAALDSGWPVSGETGQEMAWILVSENQPVDVEAEQFHHLMNRSDQDPIYRRLSLTSILDHYSLKERNGAETRSIETSPIMANDRIRVQIEELKEKVDALEIWALPFQG
jgi:serine/threonine protein kinase